MSAQDFHRFESLGDLAVLHEPAGGLGAEEDANHEDEGGDEGRTELETPGNGTDILDNHVGAEAQEDTCGGRSVDVSGARNQAQRALTSDDPELPEHDKRAANPGRGHLGRVDRDGGILCTNTDAHDEPGGKQGLP